MEPREYPDPAERYEQLHEDHRLDELAYDEYLDDYEETDDD